jgi:hypothetical protein
MFGRAPHQWRNEIRTGDPVLHHQATGSARHECATPAVPGAAERLHDRRTR